MPFTCPKCHNEFKTTFLLNRHLNNKKSCIEKTIYRCETCGYETNHKGKFDKHKARKTPCKRVINQQELVDRITVLEQEKLENAQKMSDLEKKLDKQATKKTINYNFIVANFNNAMNIEDCLNMENVTEDVINKCKKLPLKDGSLYILESLCDIDPKIRPIHCTDMSRQNFIVRSEDTWSIDNKGNTIKTHIKPVVTDVYNDIYRDKLKMGGSVDDKMKVMDNMSKELLSTNIDKSCTNAIKTTSTKFAVKNIDNDTDFLMDDESE